MTDHNFSLVLSERFNAAHAGAFDGAFRIDAGEAVAAFRVRDGALTRLDAEAEVDLTLFFANPRDAEALMTGQANVIDAFMEGRFRSDGYLIWVFTLLGMFRG